MGTALKVNSIISKKGKVEKRTEIKKIENGFIISVTKEWSDKNGWQQERKEYFSKEDPFEITDKDLVDLID